MKIELLMRRDLVCRAEIDHILRTAALGKGTRIFAVSVPELRKLPVKIHARLARQISPRPWVGHIMENIPATVQFFVSERDQGSWTVGS